MMINLVDPQAIRRALSDQALTQMAGQPIGCHYLRVKPGTSVWGEISGDFGDGLGRGWLYVHADPLKANKFRQRAERYGLPLLALGSGAIMGSMALDPALHRGWRVLRRRLSGEATTGWSLLKYRPGRRMVLRVEEQHGGSSLVRVLARCTPAYAAVVRLVHQAGLGAALQRMDTRHHIVSLQWLEGETAGSVPAERLEESLFAVARLHALHADGLDLPHYDASWFAQTLAQAERTLCWLLPALHHQVRRLTERLSAAVADSLNRPPGLVHGDFSADQIVWHARRPPRLIDVDRAGYGQPVMDIGSLLAVEMLQGNLRSLPALPYPALSAWVAYALLQRAAEPYRYGDENWQGALQARIQQAWAVLE
ncbi:aminoglycoside phosphotransferase family protein [Serratia rhizosphaerae]